MDQEAIRNLQFFDVNQPHYSFDGGWLSSLQLYIQNIWGSWTPIALFLTLLFLAMCVYAVMRIHKIRIEQQEHLRNLTFAAQNTEPDAADVRWARIERLIDSPNENDWRQAIIAADIILDEMVTAMGYHGDTLGEKMKGIEKSDFTTLDQAWEAHKVRNKIAHEGLDVDISHREARRVVKLFEEVFREFHYI